MGRKDDLPRYAQDPVLIGSFLGVTRKYNSGVMLLSRFNSINVIRAVFPYNFHVSVIVRSFTV